MSGHSGRVNQFWEHSLIICTTIDHAVVCMVGRMVSRRAGLQSTEHSYAVSIARDNRVELNSARTAPLEQHFHASAPYSIFFEMTYSIQRRKTIKYNEFHENDLFSVSIHAYCLYCKNKIGMAFSFHMQFIQFTAYPSS